LYSQNTALHALLHAWAPLKSTASSALDTVVWLYGNELPCMLRVAHSVVAFSPAVHVTVFVERGMWRQAMTAPAGVGISFEQLTHFVIVSHS
jgi:hypothetical protein